ncbi:hypothetical protein OAU50_06400 [Planctomycetota bacterium]|nr:hypothetical protein [Planctomycetota bacterium]
MATKKKRRNRISLRALFVSGFTRTVRRGFFRLVLLLFLVGFVLPFSALTFLAQPKYGNALLDEVVASVFQAGVADVSWDRDLTEFSGPTLAMTGSITYKNLVVKRAVGGTPHPVHGELDYEFARVPEVTVSFDLKKLPDLPITRVQLSDNIQLHFNVHDGIWLDEDLFKPSDPNAEPGGALQLPEIVGGKTAELYMRADGILVDPLDAPADPMIVDEWYKFRLKDLSLLPPTGVEDSFRVGGKVDGGKFGQFLLGGNLSRRGDTADLRVRTENPLNLNAEYAAYLDENIRRTVEQFQLSLPETHIQSRIGFQPGKRLNLEIDIHALNGQMCYVDFPVAATDLDADIQIRNNNILVTARGRRGSGDVSAKVQIDNAGTEAETLNIDLKVRDILIDEDLRLALLPARVQPDNVDWYTGVPVPEEEFDPRLYDTRGFADWKGEPIWNGGLIYPNVPSVLPFLCRAFNPMGIADFDMSLNETVGGYDPVTKQTETDTTLNFKVFMRDIVINYVGLPETEGDGFALPLHNVYGVVEGRMSPGQPGQYTVRGFTDEELESLGRRDDGTLTANREGLAGTLDNESERVFAKVVYTAPDLGHDPSLSINISTDGLDFDEQIMSRLPADVQDIVREFAPKGAVDINRARLSMNPDPAEDQDSEMSIHFALGSKALAGQYQFKGAPEPAKFKEVAGTIDIKANAEGKISVKLQNVQGKIDNSNVSLGLNYANEEIPVYTFESDDFVVTPQLASVLPPEIGAMLKTFDVHGHIKLNINGRMLNKEPDFTNADVEFLAGSGERSGSIRFETFPYILTNVHGLLFVNVRDTHVEAFIRSLRARASDVDGSVEESWIQISGHVRYPIDTTSDDDATDDDNDAETDTSEDVPAEAPVTLPQLDLHIQGQHIAVDSPLLDALDTMMRDKDGETSTVVSFMNDLAIEGGVGLQGRLTIDDKGEFDWRFDIELEGVAVTPKRFPMRVSDLFGTVVLDKTTVTLRNVVGRGESGEISLHEAGYSEADGWFVTIGMRGVFFENSPEMMSALPEVLNSAMKKLAPKGEFDLDLHLNGQGDLLYYNVALDTWKVDIDLGLHFDDMTGRFDVNGVLSDNFHRQNGSAFIDTMYFKDARFDRITSAVQLLGDRLEFPNLRGNFYSGWVEGRLGLEGDSYNGQLSIRGADLGTLGLAAFPDAGEFAGVLDGEVRFQSDIDSNGTIGRGRFDVGPRDRNSSDPKERACKLAPVPLFSEIFKVIGEEQNFDEGHLYFWLMPERMIIREMDFVSDAARVELFGSDEENYIMYDSQAMRMKLFFTIAPRSVIPLPLIQQVLDLLKQVLFPLFVTGTMNDPNVQPFSLDADEIAAIQDEFPRRPRGS